MIKPDKTHDEFSSFGVEIDLPANPHLWRAAVLDALVADAARVNRRIVLFVMADLSVVKP